MTATSKARAELKAVVRQIAAHPARLRRRDELVRELAGTMPRGELAELAQVSPGRVSQIRDAAVE